MRSDLVIPVSESEFGRPSAYTPPCRVCVANRTFRVIGLIMSCNLGGEDIDMVVSSEIAAV